MARSRIGACFIDIRSPRPSQGPIPAFSAVGTEKLSRRGFRCNAHQPSRKRGMDR
jgi:hypothetical protein